MKNVPGSIDHVSTLAFILNELKGYWNVWSRGET